MIIVGSRKMVQYDDAAMDETVRIYDRGMELSDPENFGEHQLTYRSGDMVAPRLEAAEPLGMELADFAAGDRDRLDSALARAARAGDRACAGGGQRVAAARRTAGGGRPHAGARGGIMAAAARRTGGGR